MIVLRISVAVGALELIIAGKRFGLAYWVFGRTTYDLTDRIVSAAIAAGLAAVVALLVWWVMGSRK